MSSSDSGACIWFTGLSGSGKSTTAMALVPLLEARGRTVTVLDWVAAQFDPAVELRSKDDVLGGRTQMNLLYSDASATDSSLAGNVAAVEPDRQRRRLDRGAIFETGVLHAAHDGLGQGEAVEAGLGQVFFAHGAQAYLNSHCGRAKGLN